MGNLRSVAQALAHVAAGETVRVTADPAEVACASRVVFPGQGAMPDCMAELARRGLKKAVLRAAAEKPFLGICIGLQMLFSHSEEGDAPGLDILPGEVCRFPAIRADEAGERLKVPHMGWNRVRQIRAHPLWRHIEDGARFYFVHSYYAVPKNASQVTGESDHGFPFPVAVANENVFAVQFHPEKSARDGLRLLANFMDWQP
jgi:glutamine amidotransferase